MKRHIVLAVLLLGFIIGCEDSNKKMSLEEIIRGPDTGEGPDLCGSWTITRAKLQGVMPGFQIKDSKGIHYLLFRQLNMYQTMLWHSAPFRDQRNEQLYRFSTEGVSYMI